MKTETKKILKKVYVVLYHDYYDEKDYVRGIFTNFKKATKHITMDWEFILEKEDLNKEEIKHIENLHDEDYKRFYDKYYMEKFQKDPLHKHSFGDMGYIYIEEHKINPK